MELRSVLSGVLLLASLASAQGEVDSPAGKPATRSASAAPVLDAKAKAAFASARQLEREARKAWGAVRSRKLELAAGRWHALTETFAEQPKVAAQAAWSAAELWRRHGSAPLAEKDYLLAARSHPARYGQRGLLGAADMQRRQLRNQEASVTYQKAEAVDPRTSHAQRARLWVARLLLAAGKLDQAIERFQAALESAPSTRQAIDAADHLAQAWIKKGDLDAAGFVLDHVDQMLEEAGGADPVADKRLRRASALMPARKALRRARDRRDDVAKDAVRLDRQRRERARRRTSP